MSAFTGIYNENEFYFAHYLAALMDDELKELCSSEELVEVQRAVKSLAKDWLKLRQSRDKLHPNTPSEEKKAYAAMRDAFAEKIFGALGYQAVFNRARPFPGANIRVPVSGVLTNAEGRPMLCLIESRCPSGKYGQDVGLLECLPAQEQCDDARLTTVETVNLTTEVLKKKDAKNSWDILITNEIFGAPQPPRFILVMGEDRLLLADRTKWAERRCMVFNLDEIYDRSEAASIRAMAGLLSRPALAGENGLSVADQLDESSHKNAFGVSKSLRVAMRDSIELLGNAILDSNRKAKTETGRETSAGDFTASSLSGECILVMYRFLFILFLESRRDINYIPRPNRKLSDDIFWTAYGIDHLRDLETIQLLTPAARRGLYFDQTIKQLFDKIYNGFPPPGWGAPGINREQTIDAVTEGGADGFTLRPLTAHLFDPDRTPYFNKSKIPNEIWRQIICKLSVGTTGTGAKKRKGRISYARLGIQQLGAVYEALLSYTGFYAKEDLYEVCKAPKKARRHSGDGDDDESPESGGTATGVQGDLFETGYFVTAAELPQYENNEIVSDGHGHRLCHKKGTFIYRMAGRDRERSASYYTPAELTRALVKHTLKERIPDDMSAKEIMRLTICEPAMGSAAFLNETVDQLADIYLKRRQAELHDVIPLERYGAEKARVKMVIADRNVYGVDLNPTATDLAEVSLWLGTLGGETLSTGNDKRRDPYIPWFGTQLKCGNSIIGARHEVVFPNGEHRALRFGEKFPGDAVWHFLLPDEGMNKHTDKVIKKLEPEACKAMSAWNRNFRLPPEKKATINLRYEVWNRLHEISVSINGLWQDHVLDAKRLDEATTDDIQYYGYKPKQGYYLSTKAKDEALQLHNENKNLNGASAYQKLKFIMDLWCSLWFWPLDKAEELPTLDEFTRLAGFVSQKDYQGKMIDELFGTELSDDQEAAIEELKQKMEIDSLYRVFPFAKTAQDVAKSQRFMHWELEFVDVFADHGGFDIIVGNPPWVKVKWNESGILSEYDPHIVIRDISADQVIDLRNKIFKLNDTARTSYFFEYVNTTGIQRFLSSLKNYPSLIGSQTNLFKFFLPLSFRILSINGVAGILHPEGIYDDPNGGVLRSEIYPRLRLHAQFRNVLGLFADIHRLNNYSINIYGSIREKISFTTIANLFHPITLEHSLSSDNVNLPLPLEKTNNGKWNLTGHPQRIVHINDETLKLLADLYDEKGTSYIQARLPALYTESFIKEILPLYANSQMKMQNVQYFSSVGWDETNARKDGTMQRETKFISSPEEMIYSGPSFFVATPIAKTPRPTCSSNGDYDSVNLNVITSDYYPRFNYFRNCDEKEYVQRIPLWHGNSINHFYRVACRMFVNNSNERTLIPILLPRGPLHINTVIGFSFYDEDLLKAVMVSALWSSLPYDWFFRTTGRNHFLNDSASQLPYFDPDNRLLIRSLLLNCVNSSYALMWGDSWSPDMAELHWLSTSPILKAKRTTGEWNWGTPLRGDLERRQALLELDVLAARKLGLSLENLIDMYRISFDVFRRYEMNTYYDQNGRIAFTPKSGAGGLPNTMGQKDRRARVFKDGGPITDWCALGWREALEKYNEPGYEIHHIITDQVMSDEPLDHTVVYKAPFFKMDREADYRTAWEMLDEQEGK